VITLDANRMQNHLEGTWMAETGSGSVTEAFGVWNGREDLFYCICRDDAIIHAPRLTKRWLGSGEYDYTLQANGTST
jgi:hypothetical protein